MKVYIVTSGEYSDYGIDKVFLDKAKADEYVRLNAGHYDAPEIEEWETSDETFEIGKYQIKKYLSIQYSDKGYNENESFSIRLREDNTESNPNLNKYPYTYDNYSYFEYNDKHTINYNKLVSDDFTEEDLKLQHDKYLKVCRDFIAKAKALLSEGYTEKQVKEMLFI